MIERQYCRISPSLFSTLNRGFELVQRGFYEILAADFMQGKATMPQTPSLGRFLPNPKLKLREQLAEVCRFRHMSHRSENAYWHWMKGFILFHGKRHPREMGAVEVQAYLSHLAVKQDVAAATQRQALNAIVFLYRDVLAVRVKRQSRHAIATVRVKGFAA